MTVFPDHIPLGIQVRSFEPSKLYPSLQEKLTLLLRNGLLRTGITEPYSGGCNTGQSNGRKLPP